MTDGNFFCLGGSITAKANAALCNDALKDLWLGCSFRTSRLETVETDALIFCVGEAQSLPVGDCEYSINVQKSGLCVSANTENGLKRGFITLARMIKMKGENAVIECTAVREKSSVEIRMAHYCVFGDTKEYELEKFVRFCGALKYTHLVLEFWGMFEFDCLKELAWKHAFSKETVRRVAKIACELGMEIVPAFNHWGHAGAGRVMHGKHVVLDQNPSLQYYFTDTGWCWNIESEKTKALLKNVRQELIEACGKGEYFHIGCDEAYDFDFSDRSTEGICSYINGIARDLASEGRRSIMWGDMLVAKHPDFNEGNGYTCNAVSVEKERYFLSHLDKNIVIADWQYWCPFYPVQTSEIFTSAGYDVIVCDWDRGIKESDACLRTAKDGLAGVMHTTWHTLSAGFPITYYVGEACWRKAPENSAELSTVSAALMRKAYFSEGDYEKSGWSAREIADIT